MNKRKILYYFILSLLLISFINCSQKDVPQNGDNYLQPPKNGNTYVIAHRGVHKNIPENTIAAYKKAIELGCDFVEIDVRITKDDKFVSVHNSTVDAYVEGITGKVYDFTLNELKQLNIGKRIGAEWENERIPTLEEILELCKDKIGIYLDLKEPYIKEIVAIIKKYKMEEQIVWYIPASRIKEIKLLKTICETCIPMPDCGPKENIDKVYNEINTKIIATDMGELDEKFMSFAHANNIKVFVDEDEGSEAEWAKIIEWGTEGIQTDDPEQLIKYLQNKKQ